ncbi:unnamed protein product, partial [marine sediment metagenome]
PDDADRELNEARIRAQTRINPILPRPEDAYTSDNQVGITLNLLRGNCTNDFDGVRGVINEYINNLSATSELNLSKTISDTLIKCIDDYLYITLLPPIIRDDSQAFTLFTQSLDKPTEQDWDNLNNKIKIILTQLYFKSRDEINEIKVKSVESGRNENVVRQTYMNEQYTTSYQVTRDTLWTGGLTSVHNVSLIETELDKIYKKSEGDDRATIYQTEITLVTAGGGTKYYVNKQRKEIRKMLRRVKAKMPDVG